MVFVDPIRSKAAGYLLRRLREALGLTREQAARRVFPDDGIFGTAWVTDFEAGVFVITDACFTALCRALTSGGRHAR